MRGDERRRIEPVHGYVSRLGYVAASYRVPGVVGGTPRVEAGRGRVEVAGLELVDHHGTGRLPNPGGEVRTPLLVAIGVSAVVMPCMPVGTEFVAVRLGGVGAVPDLSFGDRDDPGLEGRES